LSRRDGRSSATAGSVVLKTGCGSGKRVRSVWCVLRVGQHAASTPPMPWIRPHPWAAGNFSKLISPQSRLSGSGRPRIPQSSPQHRYSCCQQRPTPHLIPSSATPFGHQLPRLPHHYLSHIGQQRVGLEPHPSHREPRLEPQAHLPRVATALTIHRTASHVEGMLDGASLWQTIRLFIYQQNRDRPLPTAHENVRGNHQQAHSMSQYTTQIPNHVLYDYQHSSLMYSVLLIISGCKNSILTIESQIYCLI
jgi:hypothetical protein